MEHLLKEERKPWEHEWEGEDHPEIDNEERSHEPDQASNAHFLPAFELLPRAWLVATSPRPARVLVGFLAP